MADVPQFGVPREWIARTDSRVADLADRYADQFGIPRQMYYNLLWRENGTGGPGNEHLRPTVSSADAFGYTQFIPDTARRYGVIAGTSPEALDSQMRGGAQYMRNLAWNLGDAQWSGNPIPFDAPDWGRAIGGYIASPERYDRWSNGENVPLFGTTSQAYVLNILRDVPGVSIYELPERFQNLPGFERFTPGSTTLGIGSDAGISLGPWVQRDGDWVRDPRQASPLDLAPPERFSPLPDFNQNIPYDSPTRMAPNLEEWLNDPAGGGGLPQDVRDLAFGPAAFASTPERNVPWVTPWMIDESLGNVLQQYGYMPSNLQFNEFTGSWDVAQEAPLWVQPYGPWGNIAVDRWRDANADNPAAAGMRWYTDVLRFPQNEINLPDRTAGEELLARLGQGPGGYVEGQRSVPWLQSNVISEAFGNALRQQGLMPSNLSYNQTSGTWDTAETNPLWVNWYGPWGAEAVDRWSEAALLPEAQRMQQYVDMLRYPQVDQPLAPRNEVLTPFFGAQLEPSYYGIPNTYGVPPSGQLGNWFGQADPVTFQQPNFMGNLGLTQNYDWYFNAFNQNNPINQFGRNSGGGSWSPFSGYGPIQYGDSTPGGTFAEPIETAGGGGGNMPVDEWGRVPQNTSGYVPPVPLPAPDPQYYNSGIGPGGIEIAPGWNTTPIWNQPAAAPPTPPPSNPWAGWDMNFVNLP